MPIDYRVFIHEDDLSAMEALRAIPGFDKLTKIFMEQVTERFIRMENLSSCIKLGPEQMPEIYNLLPPICKKLQIPEPELYLKYDRSMNACTIGDTSICIILNSGLIETATLEEIETVLAHECGHILCRHNLYTFMGNFILTASDRLLSSFGLLGLISIPLRLAFFHWMRSSEFSADRVSAYYSGGSEKVTDLMIRFAGATSNLGLKINKELFMQQAKDYKRQIANSKVNKLVELYLYGYADHPLTAYRAYEVSEWCKTDTFKNIQKHIDLLPDEYVNDKKRNIILKKMSYFY